MSGPLSIVASGMITSVGNSGPATCAALRAAVRGADAGKLWDYHGGDYLQVGRPRMPQWWAGRDMLATLAAPAIEECARAAEALFHAPPDTIPILLIVAPPDRPHRWPDLDQQALDDLAHQLGRKLPRGSALIPRGRTGIMPALEQAARMLAASEHELCIVAGVESFLRQKLVDHYMLKENRLLTAATSSGFTLGEAGAAVLVTARAHAGVPDLLIVGGGQAHDPSGAGGNEKHAAKGDGLTAAARQALAAARLAHRDIDVRISDANGEHWKFKEITFATARLDRVRAQGSPPRRYGYLEHWHPLEFTGEVGSAVGPLILGWALHAGQKHYLPGPRILILTSEDGGDRAALVAEFRSNETKGGSSHGRQRVR